MLLRSKFFNERSDIMFFKKDVDPTLIDAAQILVNQIDAELRAKLKDESLANATHPWLEVTFWDIQYPIETVEYVAKVYRKAGWPFVAYSNSSVCHMGQTDLGVGEFNVFERTTFIFFDAYAYLAWLRYDGFDIDKSAYKLAPREFFFKTPICPKMTPENYNAYTYALSVADVMRMFKSRCKVPAANENSTSFTMPYTVLPKYIRERVAKKLQKDGWYKVIHYIDEEDTIPTTKFKCFGFKAYCDWVERMRIEGRWDEVRSYAEATE